MSRLVPAPVFVLVLASALLAGCTLAPAYQRPAAPVPTQWPSGPAYIAPTDLAVADWPWISRDDMPL